MISKFIKPILSLGCLAQLTACGGAPASNELQLDNDGNGRFSGSAGADWSAQEIQTQVSNQICGNGPVGQFNVSVLPSAPEFKIFSGACVSGGGGLATTGVGQNQIVTAPPAPTTPVASSSAWDGSTPIVD